MVDVTCRPATLGGWRPTRHPPPRPVAEITRHPAILVMIMTGAGPGPTKIVITTGRTGAAGFLNVAGTRSISRMNSRFRLAYG
jgi:hypothetical protein